jgi:hypothetical protein
MQPTSPTLLWLPPCHLQRRRNATRACDVIVSNECLQRRLPEDCIAELLGSSAIGNNTGSGLYASRSNVVALAVPVALGGKWLGLSFVCVCCSEACR